MMLPGMFLSALHRDDGNRAFPSPDRAPPRGFVAPSVLIACALLLIITLPVLFWTAPAPRADLTYVNPSGIHTLDPARMSWTQDFRVALNVWEGLTTLDPRTAKPRSGAALPPDVSTDGLTYTFRLKDDGYWSNGDPITSRDFVRGWRRAMEPGTSADYAFLLKRHVAGAQTYAQWRQEGVIMLSALARLRDGWAIDARQARAFACGPLAERARCLGADMPPPSIDAADDDWQRFARRISDASLDWARLYDQVFEDHRAQFDDRFRTVRLLAPDDHTLVVRLVRPCPYLMDLLALPLFLPCHESIERLRERFRGAPFNARGLVVYDPQWTKPDHHQAGYPGLITNGPYHVVEWLFKRRLRMEANPFHRRAARLGCQTVDMAVYENTSAAIIAYETGVVDFLPSMAVPYDHEIARLSMTGQRPDFRLCQVSATQFINLNCTSSTVDAVTNPFVDRRVRKAFALATDKDRIVRNVLGRGDRVAHSLVPPGTANGYEPPHAPMHDVQEAQRLLVEAGFPGGSGLPAVLLLYTPANQRIVQALAAMWSGALGVHIEPAAKESKTFAEDKAHHRFMLALGNWYADYADPTTFLECLSRGSGNNDSGYSSARYDKLLNRAGGEQNVRVRFSILREAERILLEDDVPVIPILHYAEPVAIKPYVRGLYANPRMWFSFENVEIRK